MTRTDRLVLPTSVRDAVLARARAGAPAEVCGVLVGDAGDADDPSSPPRVREARAVENVADDPRTRYELDPAATAAAIEAAEADGADLVGFYHSHPRGPAELSPTDRAEAAWPGYVYCVVVPADADPNAPGAADPETVRAWRWTGEGFDPLAVEPAE